MNSAVRDTLLLFFYCSLIYVLSGRPVIEMPFTYPMQDKMHHLLVYAILAGLAWRAFRHFLTGNRILLAALLFCSAYGASDEWHQSFVPERHADAADWLADTLGTILSLLLIRYFRRGRKQESV